STAACWSGSRPDSGSRVIIAGMTLIDLITEEAERLKHAGVSFGHGTLGAFDEAAWLVLWSLGRDLDALEAHAHDVLDAAALEKARALVTRRIETRQPAAYLTR